MKIHNVFHVSLLDPAIINPYPGQEILPPPPVEVDGEQEWHVEEIFDSKIIENRLLYLVKWVGYYADWQPAENMNKLQAVEKIHRRYPNKPGSPPDNDN